MNTEPCNESQMNPICMGEKTSRNKTMLNVNRSSPCDKIQCPGETRGYVLHSRHNFRSSDPLAREEMVHVIYSVQK